MSPRWLGFIAGMLINLGLHSLHQDLLGREAYLKVINAGWIESVYTVPIALVIIITAVGLLERARKIEEEKMEEGT